MKQLLYILFVFFFIQATSQVSKKDSLIQAVRTAKEDTNKVNALNDLSTALWTSNANVAADKAVEAFTLSKKLNFKPGIMNALFSLGTTLGNQGKYEAAEDTLKRAVLMAVEVKNVRIEANCYNAIANIYFFKASYLPSLEFYLKALKIKEALNDKKGMAKLYGNIGNVYYYIKQTDKTIEYFNKSLAIKYQLQDERGIANTLGNLGNIYTDRKQYGLALDTLNKAFAMFEAQKDLSGMANVLENISGVYFLINEFQKYREVNEKALKIFTEMEDEYGLCRINNNLGYAEIQLKNYKKAEDYFNTSFLLAKKNDQKEYIKQYYGSMSKLYEEQGLWQKAYDFMAKFSNYRDTLMSSENIKQLNELETKYQTEKKEAQLKLQGESLRAGKLELQNQKIIIYAISGFLILVLCMGLLVLRQYRLIQKTSKELTAKNEIIENNHKSLGFAFKQIEEKNKEILDSIHYAKRIQTALLPKEKYIEKGLTKPQKN